MDTVLVKIPATPEHLGTVRLIAAGLAARLGFTIDEIDDLKIAVDELSAYLTGAQGGDGVLEISFSVEEGRVEIAGHTSFPSGGNVRTALTEFSRMILDTVVDSASLEARDGHNGTTVASFMLVKSRRNPGRARA